MYVAHGAGTGAGLDQLLISAACCQADAADGAVYAGLLKRLGLVLACMHQ